jgi:hypothetical protein
MSIIPFRRRAPQSFQPSPSGLFFYFPRHLQETRVLELARSRLSPEQITAICSIPLSEVTKIIEGHA